MKILWITNIVFPPVCIEFGLPEPRMGGWMYSLLKSLVRETKIQFAVAAVYSGNEFKRIELENVVYYLLPTKDRNFKYNRSLETYWQYIDQDFNPDIAHLHGTEYAHGLSFLKSCPNVTPIVSIQGLVSIISTSYYYAGINWSEILRNLSFRDVLKCDNIFQARKQMEKRGLNEQKLIQSVNHIIGRTNWDKSHSYFINPNAKYHFCNEILRTEFYEGAWKHDTCEQHTIFLSQSSYPIKGLHQVLKAAFLLKAKYPKIKIKIAGQDITVSKTLMEKIKITGYGKFIKKEIHRLGLEKQIQFMGILNENEMKHQFLRAHLFICPSSIENSPNSLGEAQILGVPLIASYVGGVPDMLKEGVSGFMYRFEEVEMLALSIDKVFSMGKDELIRLSENEKEIALIRHDRNEITRDMKIIYQKVFSSRC